MSIPISNRRIAAAVLASALIAPAAAKASAPVAKVDSSRLAKAKTFQVQETFQKADSSGVLHPQFKMTVTAERPDKVKITARVVGQRAEPAFFLQNAGKGYEYYFENKTYRVLDPVAKGQDSEIHYLSSIDTLLKPDAPIDPGTHAIRAVSKATLDGKPMILRADTYPTAPGHDGQPATYVDHLYFDAGTGLPYRRATTVTTGGKTTTVLELDFADWVIDKPFASAQFAWNPPADAKPLTTPKLLTAGMRAPDFSVVAPDGKTVHLSDFKGKPVVLDFWATWCGPCQASMPHLESVYQQVKSQDVAVLAVCVWDKRPDYEKWVAANIGSKYNFPVYFDPSGQGDKSMPSALFHVSGIPTQYVIDKDGIIVATNVGHMPGDNKLENELSKLGVTVAAEAAPPAEKAGS